MYIHVLCFMCVCAVVASAVPFVVHCFPLGCELHALVVDYNLWCFLCCHTCSCVNGPRKLGSSNFLTDLPKLYLATACGLVKCEVLIGVKSI